MNHHRAFGRHLSPTPPRPIVATWVFVVAAMSVAILWILLVIFL